MHVSDHNPPGISWRLSMMMFLGYLPLSCWAVTMGTFIGTNTGAEGSGVFTEGFVGIAYTTGGIGALIAPLLVGGIADRFFSAERILCVLHLISATLLWSLAAVQSQWLFFGLLVAYGLFYSPTNSLSSAIAFRYLPDPAQQFPRVRVAGTVAWVVGGWSIGFLWPAVTGDSIEQTTIPMRVGAIVEVFAGLYCLTLPYTPPQRRGRRFSLGSLFGAGAIRFLGQPAFAVMMVSATLVAMAAPFYYSYANLFLNQIGISRAAGKLAFGQVIEIGGTIVLPWVLVWWGVKRAFQIGVVGWILRYALLSMGNGDDRMWMLYLAILLHGVSFTFVYLTAQAYVDRVAGSSARAAAQGLLALAMFGIGHLTGALLSGWGQTVFLTPPGAVLPSYDWHSFWLLPCFGSVLPLLLMTVCFRKEPSWLLRETGIEGS